MSDHERAIIIPVPAGEAFRFLSSVSNLPSFLPYFESLSEEEDSHVFGIAEINGRRQEVSGFFRVDHANHRLDWESDGTPGYRGWLKITALTSDESRVTVHLSVDSSGGQDLTDGLIQRDFDSVLDRLSRILQQQMQTH